MNVICRKWRNIVWRWCMYIKNIARLKNSIWCLSGHLRWRGGWCSDMIESIVCGDANCEEGMRFCVCDGIFKKVRIIVVGFRDEVVVTDGVAFWWEYLGWVKKMCFTCI